MWKVCVAYILYAYTQSLMYFLIVPALVIFTLFRSLCHMSIDPFSRKLCVDHHNCSLTSKTPGSEVLNVRVKLGCWDQEICLSAPLFFSVLQFISFSNSTSRVSLINILDHWLLVPGMADVSIVLMTLYHFPFKICVNYDPLFCGDVGVDLTVLVSQWVDKYYFLVCKDKNWVMFAPCMLSMGNTSKYACAFKIYVNYDPLFCGDVGVDLTVLVSQWVDKYYFLACKDQNWVMFAPCMLSMGNSSKYACAFWMFHR